MGEKQVSPLLLLWLACMLLMQTCCLCSKIIGGRLNNFTDQAALLAFKSHIITQFDSSSWNSNNSFCNNWVGVTCSHRRQRVTKLDLSGMALQGTISPHIGNLSFLVHLNLSHNSFNGHLPHELGHLPRLKVIDLYANKLEGNIPPSLANLSQLYYLALTNNSLQGNIPVDLGRLFKLKFLSFYNNRLWGEIPAAIFNISSLVTLSLSFNNLSGQLPADTGRSLPNLKWLAIDNNQMSGSIPISLSNASELTKLWLSYNNLTGSIPDALGHLLHLEILSLGMNNLIGAVPYSIFNTSSMTELYLSYNSLLGQLPKDTGCFLPNLQVLDVDGNQMSGSIPISLSNASKLTELWLSKNNLTGSIPDALGHLLHLEILILGQNNFTGSIPDALGHLLHLGKLELAWNNLVGAIPSSIFNLSHLTFLSLAFNQLSGHLPSDIGTWLPNIHQLHLQNNILSGQIPLSLGNASKLSILILSTNNFTGPVPITLGNLIFLRQLDLHINGLMNEPTTNKLDFLTHLTSCRLLEKLTISSNPLHGILPSSIGNFSLLEIFHAHGCQIEGKIPREFSNLSSLISLGLSINNLHGTIPSTIGQLENLQGLYLFGNRLEGSIPIELTNLRNLDQLYLGSNMLSGVIPNLFHNLSRLQIVSLENNKLARIPSSLWTLEGLLRLNLCKNSLRGVIPQEVGNLKHIQVLDLSANQFKGNIPIFLGYIQMLEYLNLSSNSLEGPIPQSFGQLINLVSMDLSSNHLNGTIPKSIEILRYLEFLNISFNNLEGEIPSNGVFGNLTAWSFIGNSKLCSLSKLHIKLNVSICLIHKNKSNVNSLFIKIIISTLVVTTSVICFSLLIIYHGKKKMNSSLIDSSLTRAHERISYQDLLHATNNFSEANLIGVGSFGSVYKGTMVDGSFIAVKVLNIESSEAWDSFTAECEVMRNVRHRNLVKIITSCSNLDFRALVLQFMSNGTLDQWLYSYNKYLSLLQRIGIMIDIASAMEYLHNHYSIPIVHCDLKPRNILLDEDMIAHVSDFGIAKLLDKDKSTTRTNTLGTIGYVAPEYGLVGKVSTKVDVYSYGILLLEILTRKKPTDSIFIEGLSLRKWVDAAFPNEIIDVVDRNLLNEISNSGTNIEEINELHGNRLSSLVSIVEVGLLCSRELADERICMKDARIKLMKIKECLSI